MDQHHRAISVAEERFFGECNTRKGDEIMLSCFLSPLTWMIVPVVVLFTKWDALVSQAFQPEDLLLPLEDQLMRQRKHAEEKFNKRNVWGDLCKMEYPPKAYVKLESLYIVCFHFYSILFIILPDMDTSDRGCNILLEQTAAALNDQSLQMLLITTQEMNIMLCIEYAVRQ